MKFLRHFAAAAALGLAAASGQAAIVNSVFTHLGGDDWMAALTVRNDGAPISFAGFTVDLPDAFNLRLIASPSGWDTILVAEDSTIPDDGFLDSFVIDPAQYLDVGESQGGFTVSFTMFGTPGALPFTVNGPDFAPLFAGTSDVTLIPEPTSITLAMLGLGLAGWGAKRNARRRHERECQA